MVLLSVCFSSCQEEDACESLSCEFNRTCIDGECICADGYSGENCKEDGIITFKKSFGGDQNDVGFSVQQTTDGGFIVTGLTDIGSSERLYILKTDQYGEELWSKNMGTNAIDRGLSVQETSDGGFIITGKTYALGFDYIYLVRTNNNGDEIWSKALGSEVGVIGNGVQQTNNGEFIIVGSTQTNSFGAAADDVYLLKTDSDGNEIWSQTLGGNKKDIGRSVDLTDDGGYIITGSTFSFNEDNDENIILIKTDENGDEQWTKIFGGPNKDEGHSVQQTIDGGFIITGSTNQGDGNYFQTYLIKTNSDGEEIWSKTFGGEDSDYGYSVQETSDGSFVVTGWNKNIENGNSQVYLLKTDGNGEEIWNRILEANSTSVGNQVQETTDGGFVITGSIRPTGEEYDVYLIKTDSNGNF